MIGSGEFGYSFDSDIENGVVSCSEAAGRYVWRRSEFSITGGVEWTIPVPCVNGLQFLEVPSPVNAF